MAAVNAMKPYQESFGLTGAGSTTGIVFITYNLGQIASFPFCGMLADGWGRRWCIFVGCLIVLIGTAVQTTASTLNQFIGGRFVLGFGASIATAVGPAYIVELAHPAYRGFMAGMYNNLWWLGNILYGFTLLLSALNVSIILTNSFQGWLDHLWNKPEPDRRLGLEDPDRCAGHHSRHCHGPHPLLPRDSPLVDSAGPDRGGSRDPSQVPR